MANKISKLLILIMQKQKLNKLTLYLLKKNFKTLLKILSLIGIDCFSYFIFLQNIRY